MTYDDLPDPMIVTSTADTDTRGTLRFAINHANSNTSEDAITFNISGAGPHTITLGSPLPTINDDSISIDGSSQPGASCDDLWGGTPHTILIRIDGGGGIVDGLQTSADATLFKGLSVTNFTQNGIRLGSTSTNAIVQCSFIGVAPDGSAAGTNNGILVQGANALIGGLNAGEGNVLGSGVVGVLTDVASSASAIRGNFIGTDPVGTSARPFTWSAINNYNGSATLSDITVNLISGNAYGIRYDDNDSVSGSSGDLVIAGNYIGVDRTGATALPNTGSGIWFDTGSVSGVTIGGAATADRNIISGNTGDGVELVGVSNITFQCNHIGLGADGLSALANSSNGIALNDVTMITIGDGTAAGRNFISSNSASGISIAGTVSSVSILGNYLGLAADGSTDRGNTADGIQVTAAASALTITDNVISANGAQGIYFPGAINGTDIYGNLIGTDATGLLDRGNVSHGIYALANSSTGLNIGAVGNGNTVSGNGGRGIRLRGVTNSTIVGNRIGTGVDGVTAIGNFRDGISIADGSIGVTIGGVAAGAGNIIAHNGEDGIEIRDTSQSNFIANSVYSNDALGIDLNADTVTMNDSGDGDLGPNDLLNFPELNSILADGSTSITYDIDLDVPVSANGYRVEFFRNSAGDASGYGEGETYLGSIDVGASGNHTGSLTATVTVSAADFITATTTRKTGASTFYITSEFSAIYTAMQLAPDLQVSMSIDVYDPLVEGIYALPNNDMVTTISVVNQGPGVVDANSINLIVPVSAGLIFYNGDFDDGGPETDAVVFVDASSALTFNPVTNLAFDNTGTKPASFAACTYTPAAGYDPAVTYVCINPSGIMATGDPDPEFSVMFRSALK